MTTGRAPADSSLARARARAAVTASDARVGVGVGVGVRWTDGRAIVRAAADDWMHNFIFNFDGYKTVHIIDAGDMKNMYLPLTRRPGDPDDDTDGRSPVDKHGNGFDDPRFPRAKRVRPMHANLGPGDILYFPAWFLHKVGACVDAIARARPRDCRPAA